MPQGNRKKKVILAQRTKADNLEEAIRERAYQLFEQRGGEHGHALEDWLRAEAEVLKENTSKPAV